MARYPALRGASGNKAAGSPRTAAHPRFKDFTAVQLHNYIGKGLGVNTLVPTESKTAATQRVSVETGTPTATTMAAVSRAKTEVVSRRQWKALASAVHLRQQRRRRKGRRSSYAGSPSCPYPWTSPSPSLPLPPPLQPGVRGFREPRSLIDFVVFWGIKLLFGRVAVGGARRLSLGLKSIELNATKTYWW